MPDDSQRTKCLTQGSLVLTPELEAKITFDLLQRLDYEHRRMGWEGPGTYRPQSWLWQRWIASRMYEGDFNHRATSQGVYSVSNRSLNVPKDFIDTHFFRASQDLIGGETFFNVMPEGPEDQSPAVKLFERYLQRRAKMTSMQARMEQALKGPFIRGEMVYKATDRVVTVKEKREVRVVMNPGNELARDSKGGIITELDKWDINPLDPGKKILLRDPQVSIAANAEPFLSPGTQEVLVEVNPSSGCQFDLPYWGDLVIPITGPNVRNADLVGHIYELALDDLADMLPENLRTPAFDEYYKQKIDGPVNSTRTDEVTAILKRGEDKETEAPEITTFRPIRIAEIWARVEVTPPDTPATQRRRADICMLVDMDLQWPISYDYRYVAMPWAKDRRNPFDVIRINPVANRWYGMGYYEELKDAADYADKNYNRIEVDMMTSGNINFRDKNATEEGKAGRPVQFRSLAVNTLVTGKTKDEAFGTVIVPSQAAEIQGVLDRELQRMQASKGIITPAEAGQTGFAAADTLGGMQILEKTSDVQLKQRERELIEGLTKALGDFAEIEAAYFDLNLAQKLFAPLSEQQQAEALEQAEAVPPVGALPEVPEIPPDNVVLLTEWLSENQDNLRNRITVSVAPKNSSAIIEESNQVIAIIEKWHNLGMVYGPQAQEAAYDAFKTQLQQLGVQNPEKALKIVTPPQQVDANGQPVTAGPAKPPGATPTGVASAA